MVKVSRPSDDSLQPLVRLLFAPQVIFNADRIQALQAALKQALPYPDQDQLLVCFCTPMDDLDFLRQKPAGQASLIVVLPEGVVTTIDDINLEVIAEKCPLLALAFEPGPYGVKHSMEEASLPLVASFLRFLYEGTYDRWDTNGFLVPCPLLLHAQLCRIGEIYDVPELSSEAHVHIIRSADFSCSYPEPPPDLCATIDFLYTKLDHRKPLLETILHYCVSCFVQHKLGNNEEFCKLVYELVPFHKDLFRINYQRGFQDEGKPDCPLPMQKLRSNEKLMH